MGSIEASRTRGAGYPEIGHRVLGGLLAEHHRGIVVRAQQTEDERARPRWRGLAQSEGEDLGVEASGQRSRGLGEVEAGCPERRAQVGDETAPDLPRARHRRRRGLPGREGRRAVDEPDVGGRQLEPRSASLEVLGERAIQLAHGGVDVDGAPTGGRRS